MTNRHLVDHLFVLLLLVLVPLIVARDYRGFLARVRSGGPDVRLAEYRKTIALQWGIVLLLGAWWFGAGRTVDLSQPGTGRLAAGAAVTVLVLGFLLVQWRGIQRMNAAAEAALRAQMESVQDLLPKSAAEHAVFRWLAVTAGVCEEVVYRAYLLWYLIPMMGPWPAVLVGGIAFGCAHAYQGKAGILKAGAVGLLAGALYVWSGWLVWPILLHAAIDLQGGAVAYRLLGTDRLPAG